MTEFAWKTIPFTKQRHRKRSPRPHQLLLDVNPDDVRRKLRHALSELIKSEFCLRILSNIRTALNQAPKLTPAAIVCYGLGSPSNNTSSIYQLAMLLVIQRFLSSDFSLDVSCENMSMTSYPPCYAYDPAFVRSDVTTLKSLGVDLIEDNEKCCRCFKEPTFVYMVHCDMWMYNNILWANWSERNLTQMALLGNSFTLMQERLPRRYFKAEYKFIELVERLKIYNELTLPGWEDNDRVFNDTVVARLRFSHHNRHVVENFPSGPPPSYDV